MHASMHIDEPRLRHAQRLAEADRHRLARQARGHSVQQERPARSLVLLKRIASPVLTRP